MNTLYVSPAIESRYELELDGYILEGSTNMGGNNLGNTGQDIGDEIPGDGDDFNHGWE